MTIEIKTETRAERWSRIAKHEAELVSSFEIARDALARFRKENLKPGEVRPGISRIMIRRSYKQKYKLALVPTPRLFHPGETLIFSNNKSALILHVKLVEAPESSPWIWLTLESPKQRARRERNEEIRRAGFKPGDHLY